MKKLFEEKVAEWEKSQEGQTSGFEYEKSFDEMWTELGREVLQESVNDTSPERKKNSDD